MYTERSLLHFDCCAVWVEKLTLMYQRGQAVVVHGVSRGHLGTYYKVSILYARSIPPSWSTAPCLFIGFLSRGR